MSRKGRVAEAKSFADLEKLRWLDGNSKGELVYTAQQMEIIRSAIGRERDEAIVGAYRAAAEESLVSSPMNGLLAKRILALTPQSALDAVERDRREIAETALRMAWDYVGICNREQMGNWPHRTTADDVLAKVGGKR